MKDLKWMNWNEEMNGNEGIDMKELNERIDMNNLNELAWTTWHEGMKWNEMKWNEWMNA